MTIANLITMLRIMLLFRLLSGRSSAMSKWQRFLLFLLAGLSDAVDGAVARYFDQQSEFGTILDPIADKMMLVSVFIVLSYLDLIPLWLVILVVSRDLLIIMGVLLAFVLDKKVTIRPLWVSKANTVAQIVLALWVLGLLAFDLEFFGFKTFLEWLAGALTALSTLAYIWQGLKLFGNDDAQSDNPVKL